MDYRFLVAWLLLLVSCTQAAFIRRLSCSLEEEAQVDRLFESLSLTGSLHSNQGNTTLSIQLLGDFVDERCNELNGESAVLTLDARVLGGSAVHGKPFAQTGRCPTLSPKGNPRSDRRTYAIYEASFPLEQPFRFRSLDTTIQLRLNNTNIDCMRAHITPYIGSTASKILLGVPLGIMLLTGIVTGLFKADQKRRRSTFRYELEDDLKDPAESSMPGLGPCLHYLQFVFLTGCLTLSYPGFFRAVLSSLSWSSLIFRNWPVTHQFTYPGVTDGIYATNATFGLEEMAQCLGSTTTSDLWTNSIVNLALLVIGVIVSAQLVSVFHWMRELYPFRTSTRPRPTFDLQREFPAFLRRTGWSVTRLVLDYCLHPLIALSLFQINNAQWFPVTHTSTAFIFVAALAGLLIVVVRRLVQTDRQAVFSPQNFPPLGFGQHWGFHLLYGIPFVRGVAMGGLQSSGLAELIILLLCEICILTCGFWNRHAGFPWRYALLSGARLATLLLSLAFLPEAAVTERTKSIVAYCILSLHLTVILLGLAVDCVYKPVCYVLYKVGVLDSAVPDRLDRAKAPVFGFAQLSHRSTRRSSFSHLPALDPTLEPSPHHTRHPSACRPGSSESSHSKDDVESFFRPPRYQNQDTSVSSRDMTFSFSSRQSYSPQGNDASDTNIEMDTVDLTSLDQIFERVHNTEEYYSQRESDQFYRPRKHTPPNGSRQSYTGISSNTGTPGPSRWKRQWRRREPKERGFEVIRPRMTQPETPRSVPDS